MWLTSICSCAIHMAKVPLTQELRKRLLHPRGDVVPTDHPQSWSCDGRNRIAKLVKILESSYNWLSTMTRTVLDLAHSCSVRDTMSNSLSRNFATVSVIGYKYAQLSLQIDSDKHGSRSKYKCYQREQKQYLNLRTLRNKLGIAVHIPAQCRPYSIHTAITNAPVVTYTI